jgi:hypothetical protein
VSRSAAPDPPDDFPSGPLPEAPLGDFPSGALPDAPLGDFATGGELARTISDTPSRPTVSRQPASPSQAQPRTGAPTLARTAAGPEPASHGATALAPAARPMVSRVAQPEQARPHLQLVRSEPAPATQPASQPTLSRAAERLAGATGGPVEQGEAGLSTVHFPPPGEISTTHQPYTISRELADPAPATPAPAPAQESASAEAPANQGEGAGEQMDPETLYEYFLDRFKRDLLIEREQLGHLIIDNP